MTPQKRQPRKRRLQEGKEKIKRYHLNIAVGALAILFGFGADTQLAGLEPETVVFPHVLLWVIKGVGGPDDRSGTHLGPEV